MTLNIVYSLIPRAQSLKNGSTYPALPYHIPVTRFDVLQIDEQTMAKKWPKNCQNGNSIV